ncbi:MAG TPA: N-6 DNA methylase, partial [Clostridiales bacterium]|nr:N-6 DNA methylase [Clostridiales bacterium]
MLNFDVKRKINTLRDILVGKVPDPKAQVEQITIALIYKFMDDMDIEGMEFGGSREFFKEDYEKYAWTNIMQPENSGQQRANLYAEGIDKMSMNPHLPQLFRDIFRGAYVPYRDAETLNMFLKEINDFSYDHSEELGNAFEYLLSIMGSQGDAGQFRTPRHIIDMMVEIVDPQKTDSILDPACGTSGFLISSYKHILEKNKDNDGNSTLSADERKRMTENFAGYDISPDMVRLSRVNMYLHKFAKPQISEYDTLSSLDKWDETYDVILANPPFMTPKGGIIPHNRYRIPAKRAEVLFVDYIAEHLNPTGKAGIIVPEGIVFQSANAYKSLRKYLVEDDLLYAVVSLPAGVFNPYSGVKTSILLMDRTLAKQKNEILFVKINNDGFDLGAQRREVKGSDIPEVINIIKDYQNGIDISDNTLVTIASKKDIAVQDYILVGERYKEAVVVNSDYPLVELGEICLVERGTSITSKELIDGDIPVIAGGQQPAYFHNISNRTGKVITVSGSGAYAGFINYFEEPIFASDCSTIQSNNSNVNLTYVYHTIKAQQDRFYELQSGMGQPHVYARDIKPFKIPLPPLHIQEEIVKEIEGYQKIIDGARQVVENYKPTIKIDPSWEMV